MNKRLRTIIISVLVFLLLVLLVLWLLSPREAEPDPVVPTTPTVQEEEPVRTFAPAPTRPLTVGTQTGAEALARTFAPRYGSFSCESFYENVRDLFPLMTDGFAATEAARIPSSPGDCEDRFGVSSSVLRLDVVSFDEEEGVAVIDVLMQREETRFVPSRETELYTQSLRLDMQEVAGAWQVSAATWLDV